MRRGISKLLFGTALTAAVAFCQTAIPPAALQFEIASVRPTANPGGEAYVQVVPGRLRMQNVAARTLIRLANGVEAYQISGGPSWIASDRFDIEAKAEGSPSTHQMQGPMLRALLEDRFKLAAHRQTKQTPVYEMRLLDGTKMRPSTGERCIPYRQDAPPPAITEPNQPRPDFCDYPHLGRQGQNRTLDGKGVTVADIAKTLERAELRRPVIDRTDLTGTFDIHLVWAPDSAAGPGNPEPPEGSSIFTALRDQLGVRLDSSRAPSEVIVVDRIEKPSAN
jgi:uncharacterized protein (TIGR03435 family)